MSVSSLCDNDSCIAYPLNYSNGPSMDIDEYPSGDGVTHKCLVQINGSGTSNEHGNDAVVDYVSLFFDHDPQITIGTIILWKEFWLRVVGPIKEGRPEEFFLWHVSAELHRGRREVS